MTIAHDVFAETNPAFCAFTLAAFTAAYSTINEDGPELPLCYVALPIALSGDLANTFNGTNKKTGLLEWLNRSPQVQVDLAVRLNSSMNLVTEAVRFGCFSHLLRLNEESRIQLGSLKLKDGMLAKLGSESTQSIKHAERLGYWFAMAGSTRTSFEMMGLTV
jgi:hypothetical protein